MSLPTPLSSSSTSSEADDSHSTPPTSSSLAPSSSSPTAIRISNGGGSSSPIRSRGRATNPKPSQVCDNCKRFKRKCDLKQPCESCSERSIVCSYTRYSLSVKYPRMARDDLTLVSQLLNELNMNDTNSATTTQTQLTEHSHRLGIRLDELLNLQDARQLNRTSKSRSSSSDGEAEQEEEEVDSEPAYRPHSTTIPCISSGTSFVGHDRQTRATSKASNVIHEGGMPCRFTGARPSPLPPFSRTLISPLEYHWPTIFGAKANSNDQNGGEIGKVSVE